MGNNARASIVYGIKFSEGFEFPWDNEKYSGDIDEWYRDMQGFKPQFEIYNEKGEYIDGQRPNQDIIDIYYKQINEFDKHHKIPVSTENYSGYDQSMYIITIPQSILSTEWGDALSFNPSILIADETYNKILIDFCNKYLLEAIKNYNDDKFNSNKVEIKPNWYLIAFYG